MDRKLVVVAVVAAGHRRLRQSGLAAAAVTAALLELAGVTLIGSAFAAATVLFIARRVDPESPSDDRRHGVTGD